MTTDNKEILLGVGIYILVLIVLLSIVFGLKYNHRRIMVNNCDEKIGDYRWCFDNVYKKNK